MVGTHRVTQSFNTYAEAPAGTPFLLYNSSNMLEIAANQVRAADLLGTRKGDVVELTLVQQAAQ